MIETSPNLQPPWTPRVAQAAGDPAPTITYTLPANQGSFFARLVVTQLHSSGSEFPTDDQRCLGLRCVTAGQHLPARGSAWPVFARAYSSPRCNPARRSFWRNVARCMRRAAAKCVGLFSCFSNKYRSITASTRSNIPS